MKKTIIILVVALTLSTLFLLPTFWETPKVLISSDKLATISPGYDFQANTTNITKQEILTAQKVAQPVDISFLTKTTFQTAAAILEDLPKNSQKLVLLAQDSNGTWYKSDITIGYFQQINDLKISSQNPKEIIYVVSGNLGTNLFFALMSLGIGLILILLVSILEFSKQNTFEHATT